MVGALRRLNTRILGIFVTRPSSGQSLGYIDGLRALAALLVLLLHVWNQAPGRVLIVPLPFVGAGIDLGPVISLGHIGVYLFFILSGFLLAQPWIEANYRGKSLPKLKQYFLLRVTRIVPAYYVAVGIVVVFLTPSLVPKSMVYSPIGLFSVVAHLLFLQDLFPISSASFHIGGQFWTLTMEMLFYLILPLVVRAFFRRRWLVSLPVAALISWGFLAFFIPVVTPALIPPLVHLAVKVGAPWYSAADVVGYINRQFPVHALEFALGMVLANAFVRARLGQPGRMLATLTRPAVATVFFVAGCVITLGTMYLVTPSMPLLHIPGTLPPATTPIGAQAMDILNTYFEMVVSVGFALILFGATFGAPAIRTALGFLPLRILGIVSYSIYLIHLPLLYNLVNVFPTGSHTPNGLFFRYLLLLLAQVIPLSIALYLFVERPAMRWARNRVRGQAARQQQGTTANPLAPAVAEVAQPRAPYAPAIAASPRRAPR